MNSEYAAIASQAKRRDSEWEPILDEHVSGKIIEKIRGSFALDFFGHASLAGCEVQSFGSFPYPSRVDYLRCLREGLDHFIAVCVGDVGCIIVFDDDDLPVTRTDMIAARQFSEAIVDLGDGFIVSANWTLCLEFRYMRSVKLIGQIPN